MLIFISYCLSQQMIASKYMNDEGEDEALTNSQWAAVGVCPSCISNPLHEWLLY